MHAKENFANACKELFAQCPGNQIEIPGAGPIALFDMPLIGFASADDPLFEKYKENEIIGSVFLSPEEWIPGAKTVAAFFFPFSTAVRDSNRKLPAQPSVPWLYGRIEGQQFLNAFMGRLKCQLENAGIMACVPSQDGRGNIVKW